MNPVTQWGGHLSHLPPFHFLKRRHMDNHERTGGAAPPDRHKQTQTDTQCVLRTDSSHAHTYTSTTPHTTRPHAMLGVCTGSYHFAHQLIVVVVALFGCPVSFTCFVVQSSASLLFVCLSLLRCCCWFVCASFLGTQHTAHRYRQTDRLTH